MSNTCTRCCLFLRAVIGGDVHPAASSCGCDSPRPHRSRRSDEGNARGRESSCVTCGFVVDRFWHVSEILFRALHHGPLCGRMYMWSFSPVRCVFFLSPRTCASFRCLVLSRGVTLVAAHQSSPSREGVLARRPPSCLFPIRAYSSIPSKATLDRTGSDHRRALHHKKNASPIYVDTLLTQTRKRCFFLSVFLSDIFFSPTKPRVVFPRHPWWWRPDRLGARTTSLAWWGTERPPSTLTSPTSPSWPGE